MTPYCKDCHFPAQHQHAAHIAQDALCNILLVATERREKHIQSMKTLVVLLSVYQSDPKQTMPFASMEENACALVLFQWLKKFYSLVFTILSLSGYYLAFWSSTWIDCTGAQMILSNSATGSTGHCIWPSFGVWATGHHWCPGFSAYHRQSH